MARSIGTIAVAAAVLGFGAAVAKADCGWDIGMVEQDLERVTRAAPLAADPTLPLGPPEEQGGFASGTAETLAERAAGQSFPAAGAGHGGVDMARIERRLGMAATFLDRARGAHARRDDGLCHNAVTRAREMLDAVRADMRGGAEG